MHSLYDAVAVIYKYRKLYERRCRSLLNAYDLKIAEIDVLCYVSHAGQKNYAKAVTDSGMSKASVSKTVEQLHRKGLVELYADSGDRRCVHIEPVGEAKKIIMQAEDIRRELEQSLSAGITEEERLTVLNVMKQLYHNLSDAINEESGS